MNFFADNNHNKSQQKLNNKPDDSVKLWEMRQEKQSIRDKSVSHQCEKSPVNSHEEQSNFLTGSQAKSTRGGIH